MSSSLTELNGAYPAPSTHGLTPRQRAERVVAELPFAPSDELSGLQTPMEPGALVEPIQRINNVMRHYGVQFELGEYEPRVVTRIIDRDSGDIIRQIPSEEVLRIAERIDELQGRLVDLQV
ncbi:MAG TPA: flagellar protein FlaG [Halomonas sp.]|nr:flagellar protein FlaG [Halomonas sp.]